MIEEACQVRGLGLKLQNALHYIHTIPIFYNLRGAAAHLSPPPGFILAAISIRFTYIFVVNTVGQKKNVASILIRVFTPVDSFCSYASLESLQQRIILFDIVV